MPFDFARRDDNPGLPPLPPDRLAAGGAIDVQPRRPIARLGAADWFVAAVIVVVVLGLLVTLP